MALIDISDSLGGSGDVSGLLVWYNDLGGAVAGNGYVSGIEVVTLSFQETVDGAGDLTGLLVWYADVSGSVAGAAVNTGAAALYMPLSDPLPGVGDILGTAIPWVNLSGTLPGTSNVSTPSPEVTFLLGGQAFGFGTIQDDLLINVAGSVLGLGQVSGLLVVISPFAGLLFGQGDVVESAPLPLRGFGALAAFVEIVRPPGPVCGCNDPPVKSFGYLQTLSRCDLTLCITDAYGNNFSPAVVTYAVYQVLRGGYKQLRGPAKRTPVMTPDGCYYAPFVAGDCGQPGDWCIIWTWQRYIGAPCESRTECFKVLDQAMQNPCDPNRKRKFGWNC